jgi:hypothetical protein
LDRKLRRMIRCVLIDSRKLPPMARSAGRIPGSPIAPLAERPAPRRLDFETLLGNAIQKRVRVKLAYGRERHLRVFEPYVVFRGKAGKIYVSGWQVRNPAELKAPSQPESFEIGLIGALSVTNVLCTAIPTF